MKQQQLCPTDIEPIKANPARLIHGSETPQTFDCIPPADYLEKGVSIALEHEFDPATSGDSMSAAFHATDTLEPSRRLNKFEQVWLTEWLLDAYDIDAGYLTESARVKSPECWVDITGGILEEALNQTIHGRLVEDFPQYPPLGIAANSDSVTSLAANPVSRAETDRLVTTLATETKAHLENETRDITVEEAFAAIYDRERDRLPDTTAEVASVLDGLQSSFGMDGGEVLPNEQTSKTIRISYADGIQSQLYPALRWQVRARLGPHHSTSQPTTPTRE